MKPPLGSADYTVDQWWDENATARERARLKIIRGIRLSVDETKLFVWSRKSTDFGRGY